MLAKAVAGEANVPFFSISGSDFVEMFVRVGAFKSKRTCLNRPRRKAPCIVFIDEIDAVGRGERTKCKFWIDKMRKRNYTYQLLTEMDGFGTNMVVIINLLLPTEQIYSIGHLCVPVRFDRQIHVNFPTLSKGEAIFRVHLPSYQT